MSRLTFKYDVRYTGTPSIYLYKVKSVVNGSDNAYATKGLKAQTGETRRCQNNN